MMETLKFVIVGHVDHGKSTLIGRLLYETNSLPPDRIEAAKEASKSLGKETEFAYLLDHLEEERQQGITIDTTQVFFKTDKRHYVIIDAPGHVEFVKNMITGASQAEAAVLIVDVKEGVKEQTKRHAYFLSLLGLSQVIVALNKIDLVEYNQEKFEDVKREVEEFLRSIGIEALSYIPISAKEGENVTTASTKMPWFRGPSFLGSLESLKERASSVEKPLLLPVQDVYKVNQRIVVGRVEAGTINRGEEITVLPDGQKTRIKSIEKYLEKTNTASAGESIGITTQDEVFMERGNLICSSGQKPVLTDTFCANIFWLAKRDCAKEERLIIRCATQETMCTLLEIKKRINSSNLEVLGEQASIIKPLEVAEVVIKTKKPIVITTFSDIQELGRFVLVRNENICAGGIISDSVLT